MEALSDMINTTKLADMNEAVSVAKMLNTILLVSATAAFSLT